MKLRISQLSRQVTESERLIPPVCQAAVYFVYDLLDLFLPFIHFIGLLVLCSLNGIITKPDPSFLTLLAVFFR